MMFEAGSQALVLVVLQRKWSANSGLCAHVLPVVPNHSWFELVIVVLVHLGADDGKGCMTICW